MVFTNGKAREVDANYAGNLRVTAGYSCPIRARTEHPATNSRHIHGKALDFSAPRTTGIPDATTSKANYDMYMAGRAAGATYWLLYDKNDNEYDEIPAWPKLPAGFSGKFYTHGHLQWPL